MKLPGQLEAEVAIKGLWLALAGLVALLLVGALVVQTVRIDGLRLCADLPLIGNVCAVDIEGWKPRALAAKDQRDAERAAHRATKDSYREAQAEAARLETARLARVRKQQEDITNAIENSYRARLVDLGVRAERLREELRARGEPIGSRASEPGTPVRDAPGRADEAAGDPRLPPDRGEPAEAGHFGRTPEEQLERDIVATRQALQLEALIDWVAGQAAIDPNAEPPPAGHAQSPSGSPLAGTGAMPAG